MHGIKILFFIDKGLGSSSTHVLAVKEGQTEKTLYNYVVFVINSEKLVWLPQKELIWLWIKIDSSKQCFSIAGKDISSINKLITTLLQNLPYSTAR